MQKQQPSPLKNVARVPSWDTMKWMVKVLPRWTLGGAGYTHCSPQSCNPVNTTGQAFAGRACAGQVATLSGSQRTLSYEGAPLRFATLSAPEQLRGSSKNHSRLRAAISVTLSPLQCFAPLRKPGIQAAMRSASQRTRDFWRKSRYTLRSYQLYSSARCEYASVAWRAKNSAPPKLLYLEITKISKPGSIFL